MSIGWLNDPCGCAEKCGDDGDVDGPGVCKGLPRMPEPPLIEFFVVHRDDRAPLEQRKAG